MNARADETGVDALLQHRSWIRDLAHSLIPDAAAAEDLAQEAWVVALTRRPATDRPLRPWLGTVLRNLARGALRGRSSRARREANALPRREALDPEEICERLETERLLAAELERLEEPFRSTLFLRFYRGLEPREIARRQALPDGTVRWRLKRGLDHLRRRLDRRCGGDGRSWCLLLVPFIRVEKAAAAGVAGSSATLAGVFTMSASAKLAAAISAAVLIGIGLWMSAALPGPALGGSAQPAREEVSLRPVSPAATVGETLARPAEEATPERRSVELAEIASSEAGTLPTTCRVEALIVNAAGQALGGAELRRITEAGVGETAASSPGGLVQLELDAGQNDGRVKLEATVPGYTSHSEDVRLEAGRVVRLGTIVLLPGGVVRGRVLDENGRGLAGVVLTHAEGTLSDFELERLRFRPADLARRRWSTPRSVSGEGGAFTLGGLEQGYWRLWAEAEGRRPAFTGAIEVREGQASSGVEIVLAPLSDANRIHGIVLDPKGAPVPLAHLRLNRKSAKAGLGITGLEERAEADGTFAFVVFEDTRMSISASDPERRYGLATAQDVTTGAERVVLQLRELERARLVVLCADGEPAERYAVSLLSPDERMTHLESESAERPAGVVELALPDTEFLVRVQAPQHRIELAGPFHPDTVGEALELRLQALRGLAGRVHAGREPVAGARVSLHAVPPGDEFTTLNGVPCKLNPIAADETRTDEEGRFLLSVHADGEYFVAAEKEGYAPAELGPLTLAPDRTPSPVELRLGAGGAIEGRVIADGAGDVAGTIVGVWRGDGHPRTQRVDSDGCYRFEGLTPGPWVVEPRDEEFFPGRREVTGAFHTGTSFAAQARWSCEVREGRTTHHDLHLALERGFTLAGSLRLEGHLPHAWNAWLLGSDEQPWDIEGPGTRLDPGGAFELSAAEPGDYQLVIRSSFGEQEEQYVLADVRLVLEETPWSLELSTGSLIVEGVEPPDEDSVVAFAWEGHGGARYACALLPDENGVCELKAVPLGRGKLVHPTVGGANPVHPRDWEALMELEIVAGETCRVALP